MSQPNDPTWKVRPLVKGFFFSWALSLTFLHAFEEHFSTEILLNMLYVHLCTHLCTENFDQSR